MVGGFAPPIRIFDAPFNFLNTLGRAMLDLRIKLPQSDLGLKAINGSRSEQYRVSHYHSLVSIPAALAFFLMLNAAWPSLLVWADR